MTFNQKLKFISILSRNTLLRDFVILLNHFPRLHDTLIKISDRNLFLSSEFHIHATGTSANWSTTAWR